MHKILIGIVNLDSFCFFHYRFSTLPFPLLFPPVRFLWSRISKVNSVDVKILDQR